MNDLIERLRSGLMAKYDLADLYYRVLEATKSRLWSGKRTRALMADVSEFLHAIAVREVVMFEPPVKVEQLAYFVHDGVVFCRTVKSYRVRNGGIYVDVYTPLLGRILHVSEVFPSRAEAEAHVACSDHAFVALTEDEGEAAKDESGTAQEV